MSNEESAVTIDTLREVVNRALDHVQEAAGDRVELDRDYFWSLPPQALYDVYTQPEPDHLTIGQVSESWASLTRLRQQSGPIPAHALVWLADVLRALGHQVDA